MASEHKVFVYGTLRPWEEGHYLPATHRMLNYKMYSAGSFPYIVPHKDSWVWGNVITVTDGDLVQLDGIEGVKNGLYTREVDRAYGLNESPMKAELCFVYVAGPLLLPNAIESGDWEQYQRSLHG